MLEPIMQRRRISRRRHYSKVLKVRLLGVLLRYKCLSLIRLSLKRFNKIFMSYGIRNWIKYKGVMKNPSFNLKRVFEKLYKNNMKLISSRIRTPDFQKVVLTSITFCQDFLKGSWMEFMVQKKSQRKNIELESRQELEYRWAILIRTQIS